MDLPAPRLFPAPSLTEVSVFLRPDEHGYVRMRIHLGTGPLEPGGDHQYEGMTAGECLDVIETYVGDAYGL